MYTILLDESNELKTSVRERIMQRSKIVDSLHFLVDPIYKGIEMNDFVAMLEYILPVSREYHTEILVKSDELYKEKLEYILPFDTNLTREAGDIEIQLTFVRVVLNPDGSSTQQVRKTSPTTITILPITAWSDIIPDGALSSIDQRIMMTQAMLEAANEMANYLDETKADNIVFDKDTNTLQLTSCGNVIGNKITLNGASEGIVAINIDNNGNLIAIYNDGRQDTVGKVGANCVGTYVPSMNQDIMTFTLTNNPTEKVISFDIDKDNNWNEIDGSVGTSDYIWQEL